MPYALTSYYKRVHNHERMRRVEESALLDSCASGEFTFSDALEASAEARTTVCTSTPISAAPVAAENSGFSDQVRCHVET